ncbi:hypothetical protein SAMN05216249_1188 [Acetitomaculum ruminis DSM 5522]|uniref:Uncharacterized protein n=1 Tax=Acetitomaculum ruminis DSM 5522 TaxID=1120918 RepID=A0A1I0ZYV4_9FIRM|nr:hypothetical protein [Acetitomaculum ruminis]SFB29620.1 hypothetical protein SAMN05216249_1188 [Acetitomaculum ruminis DSM 5522]
MNVAETLEKLKKIALKDEELMKKLISTRKAKDPLLEFCKISCQKGCDLSVIDLVNAGEEAYAAMRRSTNGGGENSPLLHYEDDYYELFLGELEAYLSKD